MIYSALAFLLGANCGYILCGMAIQETRLLKVQIPLFAANAIGVVLVALLEVYGG